MRCTLRSFCFVFIIVVFLYFSLLLHWFFAHAWYVPEQPESVTMPCDIALIAPCAAEHASPLCRPWLRRMKLWSLKARLVGLKGGNGRW